MIAVLVDFELPPGMTPDEARDVFRRSAEGWVGNHELIEKFYFLDAATGRGGGLYLWPTREMAERHHGPAYVRTIAERYGSQPTTGWSRPGCGSSREPGASASCSNDWRPKATCPHEPD